MIPLNSPWKPPRALLSPCRPRPRTLTRERSTIGRPSSGAKRRIGWTNVDIALASTLARDLGTIEQLSEVLAREGHVLTDACGKRYANPAANLLDQTTRRAANTARAIQIHAIATTGRVQDGAKKNEAAREITAQVSAASDLIARAPQ